MTEQIIPYSHAYLEKLARKEYQAKYYLDNKEKLVAQIAEYHHSREGLVTQIHSSQKQTSRRRSRPMPNYSKDELKAWIFGQPNFERLYQRWAGSGFDRMQKPSCDRLDDYKPYTLNNLQMVTWAENRARAYADKKAGMNTKQCKAVIQFTKEGGVIAEHYSTMQAERITGIHNTSISACCNGKQKTAGGFVWQFA